jgi:tRNA U34 2-thiouridine synthase MnmA/TrmU
MVFIAFSLEIVLSEIAISHRSKYNNKLEARQIYMEDEARMTKAIALLSGGLDSTLAVKLMIDQGIEVHAMNFTSAFCTCDSGMNKKKAEGDEISKGLGHVEGDAPGCKGQARVVSEKFGVPIKVINKGPEYIDIIRNPKYGYGKGVNPCVDCRIYMFKAAKDYMKEIGASFIITGEVVGQRPMSQRRDNFSAIERDTGLEGLILRPLCALNLEPTIPEKEGLVDREKLLQIAGRGRRPQMDMADELDIGDYPCPSGGCLLTDKIFSKKVRDLLDHKEDITTKDLQLLKTGRHFRFKGAKVVIGRDEADNRRLNNLTQPGETLIEPINFPGPNAIVSGAMNGDAEIAAFVFALIVRYSAEKAGSSPMVRITMDSASEERVIEASKEEVQEVDSHSEEYNVC